VRRKLKEQACEHGDKNSVELKASSIKDVTFKRGIMTESLIDLRSDTSTLPTQEMRDAMYRAEVGDSMRGEDPTMNKFEELAAEKLGKEAAIYVPSGTMGNLVSLMAHTQHGDEIILEADHHSYYYEVGGYAALRGLSPRIVQGKYGVMAPEEIEQTIRAPSPYFPPTRLLVIENTHNRGGGNAITLREMAAMTEVARRHNLAIHLDGARIFNAAVALDVAAKEIASFADSVQFCLSKGLSAPVGSAIAGSNDFIARARGFRKIVGGDLRQSGILAAAGIVALEKMVDRLAEDHHNASLLAAGLREIPHIKIDNPPVPTNMVFIDTSALSLSGVEFIERLQQYGILAVVYGPTRVRMVTHRHIKKNDINQALHAIRKLVVAASEHLR
jgi:threonine aldolase